MPDARKRRRLQQTVDALRRQYGEGIVRRASEMARPHAVAHVPTGFPELDDLTGCGGVPLNSLTLLSGRTTSGKLTLAYKVLAAAQRTRRQPVAILDLTRSSDPDYLARCGVDLKRLLFVRPDSGEQAVNLLLELVAARQVQALLVDSLADLARERNSLRHLNRNLVSLQRLLHDSGCGLLLLDEAHPPWLRWLGLHSSYAVEQWAALHLHLQREAWLYSNDELAGYRAQAQLRKSRWASAGAHASVVIRFNGTVHAGASW